MSLDSLNTYNNRSSQSSSTGSSSGNETAPQNADPISNLFHNLVGTIFPSAFPSTSSSSSISAVTSSAESGEETSMAVDTDSMEAYHSDSEQKIDHRNRVRRGVKRKHAATTGARKKQKSEQCPQYKINYICSCLQKLEIKSREDLFINFKKLINLINDNSKIFKSGYTEEECFEIFKQALTVYNRINNFTIDFSDGDVGKHHFKKAGRSAHVAETDNLTRITHSYDRLAKSHEAKKSIHEAILENLKSKEFATCPSVIIGAGDTGVTVWSKKYKEHHGKTNGKLAEGQLPEVLIIAENRGCMGFDYTLTQPHSFLERPDVKWNPSNYVTQTNYQNNAFVNGRHLYQANEVILGKTEAPVLTASMTAIEEQSKHPSDWKCKEYDFRVILTTAVGKKIIYTNNVDICTGPGPARKIPASIIPQADFDRLNQFDKKKQYTPLVSGNQFILTNSEDNVSSPRSIVVYGGGGTASACFRKAFFGEDKGTHSLDLEFTEENRKHSVKWIARNYDAVGTGQLASKAMAAASSQNVQLTGELTKITVDSTTGKLQLVFKAMDPSAVPATFVLECDQLVYSIGQDDISLKKITQEFEDDMRLDIVSDVPIGLQTPDGKIHAYGAASMALKNNNSYIASTTNWLKKENIAPDVATGTIPPSRAQIQQAFHKEKKDLIAGVNVNSDSKNVMENFLEQAGVNPYVAFQFLEDIMEARKTVGFHLNPVVLQDLLDKHSINGFIEISGHGNLVKR